MKKKSVAKKAKKFTVRMCPKCKSDDVGVMVGGATGMWECHKCGFQGPSFIEKEMDEDEFLEYEEKKGGLEFDLGEPQTVEEKKSHKEKLKEKMEKGEKI